MIEDIIHVSGPEGHRRMLRFGSLRVNDLGDDENWHPEASCPDGWPKRLESSGGYKDSINNPDKLPLALIPKSLFDALGRSLGHGARKYAVHNWRQGIAWSEVYSGLLRHTTAWWEGEDTDPDSGNHHLDNALACLVFLRDYSAHPERYSHFDDRYKGQK